RPALPSEPVVDRRLRTLLRAAAATATKRRTDHRSNPDSPLSVASTGRAEKTAAFHRSACIAGARACGGGGQRGIACAVTGYDAAPRAGPASARSLIRYVVNRVHRCARSALGDGIRSPDRRRSRVMNRKLSTGILLAAVLMCGGLARNASAASTW